MGRQPQLVGAVFTALASPGPGGHRVPAAGVGADGGDHHPGHRRAPATRPQRPGPHPRPRLVLGPGRLGQRLEQHGPGPRRAGGGHRAPAPHPTSTPRSDRPATARPGDDGDPERPAPRATVWHAVRYRGTRAVQAVRAAAGRRRPQLRGRRGSGHRVPRAQRLGQDDHPADAAGAGLHHRGHRHLRWAALPRPRPPHPPRRSGAGGHQLPPHPPRRGPPEDGGPGRRHAPDPGGRDPGPGRPDRRGPPTGGQVLPGHAPAPAAGHRPARRPGDPHPGRAVQRPRPPGHPVAPHLHPPPGLPRARRAGLLPPALRDGGDRRRRGHHLARSAGAPDHPGRPGQPGRHQHRTADPDPGDGPAGRAVLNAVPVGYRQTADRHPGHRRRHARVVRTSGRPAPDRPVRAGPRAGQPRGRLPQPHPRLRRRRSDHLGARSTRPRGPGGVAPGAGSILPGGPA